MFFKKHVVPTTSLSSTTTSRSRTTTTATATTVSSSDNISNNNNSRNHDSDDSDDDDCDLKDPNDEEDDMDNIDIDDGGMRQNGSGGNPPYAATALAITIQDWDQLGIESILMMDDSNPNNNNNNNISNETTTNVSEKQSSLSKDDYHYDRKNKKNLIFMERIQQTIVERITALLLIRIVAVAVYHDTLHSHQQDGTTSTSTTTQPKIIFNDYSTSTICRTVLVQQITSWEQVSSVLTTELINELYHFVYTIIRQYNHVPYHNCEHAYHVVLSTNKLIDLLVVSNNHNHMNHPTTTTTTNSSSSQSNSGSCCHKNHNNPNIVKTFGLKYDPISLMSLLFAAVIHDVEHLGIPNRQLVMERNELAILYNDQSIAENRSIYIGFYELLYNNQKKQPKKLNNKKKNNNNYINNNRKKKTNTDDNQNGIYDYHHLRRGMFTNTLDSLSFRKFRSLVVDLVLITDIASSERTQITKSKWKEAFGDPHETLERKLLSLQKQAQQNQQDDNKKEDTIQNHQNQSTTTTTTTKNGTKKNRKNRNRSIHKPGPKQSSSSSIASNNNRNQHHPPFESNSFLSSDSASITPDTSDVEEMDFESSIVLPNPDDENHDDGIIFAKSTRNNELHMSRLTTMSVYHNSSTKLNHHPTENHNNNNNNMYHTSYQSLLHDSNNSSNSGIISNSSSKDFVSWNDGDGFHESKIAVELPSRNGSFMMNHSSFSQARLQVLEPEEEEQALYLKSQQAANDYFGYDNNNSNTNHTSKNHDPNMSHSSFSHFDLMGASTSIMKNDNTTTTNNKDNNSTPNHHHQNENNNNNTNTNLQNENDNIIVNEIILKSPEEEDEGSLNEDPMSSINTEQQISIPSIDNNDTEMKNSIPGNNHDDPSHTVRHDTTCDETINDSTIHTTNTTTIPKINKNIEKHSVVTTTTTADSTNVIHKKHNMEKMIKKSKNKNKDDDSDSSIDLSVHKRSMSKKSTPNVNSGEVKNNNNNNNNNNNTTQIGFNVSSVKKKYDMEKILGKNIDKNGSQTTTTTTTAAITPNHNGKDVAIGSGSDDHVRNKKKKEHAIIRNNSATAKLIQTKLVGGSFRSRSLPLLPITTNNSIPITTLTTNSNSSQNLQEKTKTVKFQRRLSTRYSAPGSLTFRKRLGIRRSMDLTGESLEVYPKVANSSDMEHDEPDELKVSVVLETIMTAADVAHNLQGWDQMVKWSSRLYLELRKAYVEGRSTIDPRIRWYENQIGFLESYLLPLARRLEDTGVFGPEQGEVFGMIVEANRDKWLVHGMDITNQIIAEGDLKYPFPDTNGNQNGNDKSEPRKKSIVVNEGGKLTKDVTKSLDSKASVGIEETVVPELIDSERVQPSLFWNSMFVITFLSNIIYLILLQHPLSTTDTCESGYDSSIKRGDIVQLGEWRSKCWWMFSSSCENNMHMHVNRFNGMIRFYDHYGTIIGTIDGNLCSSISTDSSSNKQGGKGREQNKECQNGLYHDMDGIIYVGGERIRVIEVAKGYKNYFTNWPFEMDQIALAIREM